MQNAVELFAIVNFLIIGISHILAPRAWASFFDLLRQKGEPGVFVVAFLSLNFGSIIVAFHNVWSGVAMVLAIPGWAQVLKMAPSDSEKFAAATPMPGTISPHT